MNNFSAHDLAPLSADDLALLYNHVAGQGLPEQVEAITCDAPLTVVSAGAGTGKTWTLAWRFVWTVLTRTDARRMLTLTFTEKAATEMKSRIAALLASLEPDLRRSPELSRRRAEALKWIDQAYISTMHSFGRRVIAEAGLSLPVEPSLRLIGDAEKAEFWNEVAGALDRLDAEWFARGTDESYARVVREILSGDDAAGAVNHWRPEGIAKFAANFENMMGDFGRNAETLLSEADSPDDKILERLREECSILDSKSAENWRNAIEIDPREIGGKGEFVEKFSSFRSRWLGKDFSSPENCSAFIDDAASTVKGARGKVATALAEILGMSLSDWRKETEKSTQFRRLLSDGWSENEIRLRRLLIQFAWICWKKWQIFKLSRGGITFGDMISLAGQALENDPAYAARFSEVLVDEFQDTNKRQDGLLATIRSASNARFFIVGDLKQSIYRFRNAEPTLFERYIAEARSGGGRYVSLSVSFRSSEAVLDAVNRRFEKIWTPKLGTDLNVPYEPLNSPRGLERATSWIDDRQKNELPVCGAIFEDYRRDDSGRVIEKIAEVRARLALRVVKQLVDLRASGTKIWGRDGLRPIEWGDMAILVPTRTSYESLRHAFLLAGVPAIFTADKSYYKKMEVRDMCSLVAFLANPSDRTSLAGFLCSPFSGISQDEAQSLIPLLAGGSPLEILRATHPKIADRLEFLCKTSELNGPSASLASLLSRGDLLTGIHPRKRAGAFANLRRAVSLLKDYEDSVSYSPVGAASYLRQALRDENEAAEAPSESGDDAVVVMTVHASKGLEFPLVVLFGTDQGGKKGLGEGIVPSRSLLAAASKFPENWQVEDEECLLGKVHEFLENRAEKEEKQRLYYVALTRARDGIILCGIVPSSKKGADDRSFLAIEPDAEKFQPAQGEISAAEIYRLREREKNFTDGQSSAVSVRLKSDRPRNLRDISATSFALWQACPGAWRMKFRQNIDLTWNASDDESFGDAGGTGFGSVAHLLLSKWDFTDEGYLKLLALDDGHLRPEFRRVWREKSAKAELRKFLDAFHNPAGRKLTARLQKALRDGTLERERAFKVKIDQAVLVGFIDLFWIENDESGKPTRLCLRDYKTTRFPSDALRRGWMTELYAAQLRFYALALRALHPEYAHLELDLALWDLRRGEEQKCPSMNPEQEKIFIAALQNQSRQAATGPWTPNYDRCAGCAFARGCIFKKEDA